MAVAVFPIDPVFAEEGITVTEKRLDNGDSEITVTDNGKVTATYKINMSKHHHPALTKDDPLMKRWSEFKFGAFLCYNMPQYTGKEFTTSNDVNLFAPTKLDVRQWVSTFKAAGMDHAILTVRYTSDFLLWDSATSECDVMHSGVKTDIVKQYVEECRRQNIKPGIYYCLWGSDKHNPNPNARALILAQLHELATKYGPIPYFWIDMARLDLGWLTPDLSQQEIYDSLKNVNPNCIVMVNNGLEDGSVLSGFPSDVVNGEVNLPPAAGHNPIRKVGDKTYYIPFEYAPTSQNRISPGEDAYTDAWDYPGASWFTYGEGKSFVPSKPFAPIFLYGWIEEARKRGASNIMLACAPDYTGSFREEDIKQLTELGKIMTERSLLAPKRIDLSGCKVISSSVWDYGNQFSAEKMCDDKHNTRWASAANTKDGWVEIDLGQAKRFSKVSIREYWDVTRKFELQIRKDGQWVTIHKGATIGDDYWADFKPVKARQVRLNILQATDVPSFWEVELFKE